MRHELALDELESNLRELLVSKGHAEAMQMVLERDLGFRFSGRFVLGDRQASHCRRRGQVLHERTSPSRFSGTESKTTSYIDWTRPSASRRVRSTPWNSTRFRATAHLDAGSSRVRTSIQRGGFRTRRRRRKEAFKHSRSPRRFRASRTRLRNEKMRCVLPDVRLLRRRALRRTPPRTDRRRIVCNVYSERIVSIQALMRHYNRLFTLLFRPRRTAMSIFCHRESPSRIASPWFAPADRIMRSVSRS